MHAPIPLRKIYSDLVVLVCLRSVHKTFGRICTAAGHVGAGAHQRGFAVANAGRRSGLVRLTLPVVLAEVDWIVSLAKLKTHHWGGATLAMVDVLPVCRVKRLVSWFKVLTWLFR